MLPEKKKKRPSLRQRSMLMFAVFLSLIVLAGLLINRYVLPYLMMRDAAVIFDEAIASEDYYAGIDELTENIKLAPDNADNYAYRAWLYLEKTPKTWIALDDANRAIELNEENALAYYIRGAAQLNWNGKAKYEDAISDYERAFELDPNFAFTEFNSDYARAYNARANYYQDHTTNYELALADYNRSIELDPEYSHPYYNRGNLYHSLENLELAIADYTRAMEIEPNMAMAYNNRGYAYYLQDNTEDALNDYCRAVELDYEINQTVQDHIEELGGCP